MSVFKKVRSYPWRLLLALAGSIISGGWAGDVLKGEALFAFWSPWFETQRVGIALLVLLLFVGSLVWLYRERHAFFGIRVPHQYPVAPPRSGLVMTVSIPHPQACFSEAENGGYTYGISELGEREFGRQSLTEDIEALAQLQQESGKRWNWLQLLRAIEPHQNHLKHLYLVGSGALPDSEGSQASLDDAERLIHCYAPDVDIRKTDCGVDFYDLYGLISAISAAIDELASDGRLHIGDIVIDVTGGTVTASIAGAVLTLKDRCTFQYVETAPSTEEGIRVRAYDAVSELFPDV